MDSIIDELLPYLNQINTTAAGIDDTTAQVTSGDNILGGLGGLSGLDGILATVTSLVPNITSLLGSINAGGAWTIFGIYILSLMAHLKLTIMSPQVSSPATLAAWCLAPFPTYWVVSAAY